MRYHVSHHSRPTQCWITETNIGCLAQNSFFYESGSFYNKWANSSWIKLMLPRPFQSQSVSFHPNDPAHNPSRTRLFILFLVRKSCCFVVYRNPNLLTSTTRKTTEYIGKRVFLQPCFQIPSGLLIVWTLFACWDIEYPQQLWYILNYLKTENFYCIYLFFNFFYLRVFLSRKTRGSQFVIKCFAFLSSFIPGGLASSTLANF